MGKGSTRRKRQVSRQQVDTNWEETFKRKPNNDVNIDACVKATLERHADVLKELAKRDGELCETNNGTCGCDGEE